MKKRFAVFLPAIVILLSSSAGAITLSPFIPDPSANQMVATVFDFDEGAAPDELFSHTLESNDVQGLNILSSVADGKLNSYIDPDYAGDYVVLGFTDQAIRNDSGFDVAVFELWAPEAIRVARSVADQGILAIPTYTGYKTVFVNGSTARVNLALIDLDDLGFGAGELVSALVIGATGEDSTNANNLVSSPEIAGVFALHNHLAPQSVPEPPLLAILGLGLAGLVWSRRLPTRTA